MYRFALYVPKAYREDFRTFVLNNGKDSSRILCNLVKDFNKNHLSLDIPTLRKRLEDPKQRKFLKELLDEWSS